MGEERIRIPDREHGEGEKGPGQESAQQDSAYQPTPFDHPLFLPVLFLAFCLWFGYDGWLNSDPDMLEHLSFNRYGFGVLLALTVWFGVRGLKEFNSSRSSELRDSELRPKSD